MKLGVIGEPCIDFIHREGKEADRHLGGILYSVVSLAVISGKHDEIYPIMNLGNDEYDNVLSLLTQFENIRTDYIFKSRHSTRVVKLFYRSASGEVICHSDNTLKMYDREESSTEPAPPIKFEQIIQIAEKMDGILVNMVSGNDIELETLKLLRKNYEQYIHLDVHNIVMRTGEEGSRFRGPVADWLEWCTNCTTLQMNEAEIHSISPERLGEYETVEKILVDNEVRCVIVTRGGSGVTMFEKRMKTNRGRSYEELDKIDLPAIESPRFVDSTGCGDVFASAFFYKNIENNLSDLNASLHFANRLASRKSELNGVDDLRKLI